MLCDCCVGCVVCGCYCVDVVYVEFDFVGCVVCVVWCCVDVVVYDW